MIPFSILRGQLKTKTGSGTEFSVLELGPDFFTLRLAKNTLKAGNHVTGITMSFYAFDKQTYMDVSIDVFTVTMEKECECFDIFRIDTDVTAFTEASNALSADYLEYIEAKLNLEEDELSNQYTDYPLNADDDFYKDIATAKEEFVSKAVSKLALEKWEDFETKEIKLYLALENPDAVDEFLNRGYSLYAEEKYGKLYKIGHPLFCEDIAGIYIGNAFCPHLIPDAGSLKRIISIAEKNDLEVYITIPPCSETYICETLDYIRQYMKDYSKIIRFSVNDMGTYDFIVQEYGLSIVEKGIFLNKAYRDPRSRYLVMAKDDNLMITGKKLYAPFYQTNTGTFCTYKALLDKGDRGFYERINNCNKECLKGNVIYPKHLNTIGRYNSIFSFDEDIIVSPHKIYYALEKGLEGVVINL